MIVSYQYKSWICFGSQQMKKTMQRKRTVLATLRLARNCFLVLASWYNVCIVTRFFLFVIEFWLRRSSLRRRLLLKDSENRFAWEEDDTGECCKCINSSLSSVIERTGGFFLWLLLFTSLDCCSGSLLRSDNILNDQSLLDVPLAVWLLPGE